MIVDFTKANVLNEILRSFTSSIDAGFGFIESDVIGLMTVLLLIAIVFTGIRMMLSESGEVITAGRRAMVWTVIIYLVNTWQTNTDLVRSTALTLGLKAAGPAATGNSALLSPSGIVELGLAQLNHLLATGTQGGSGIFGIHLPSWDAGILFLAGIVILIAFVLIALQLMITIIEFKLLTLASFILIPFGILTRTSFLMERALGYVASAGLKFLTLSFIVAISMSIVSDFNASYVRPDNPFDTSQAFMLMVTAIIIAGLAITIPATAAGLITGGPSLGIGALAGGAAVGAGVAAGAAGVGVAAVSGGSAASAGVSSMKDRITNALSAGGGTLKTAGSIAGKAAGISAGMSTSQGPRGGIGETSSNQEGNS